MTMMMCCVYLPFFKKIIFNEQQWPFFEGIQYFIVYVFLKCIRSKFLLKTLSFQKTQNNKYNEANTPSASEDSRGDRTHDGER